MDGTIRDRFRGCLVGQCLGDALGAPVEGRPGAMCKEYVNRQMEAWHRKEDSDVYFGQYTDDSQLAREMMQSYVERGDLDPCDYARRIGEIFAENRIVGRGLACDQAATRLIRGVPWDEAGCPAPSAGNGTAMRAAPAGLLYYDDPEKMRQIAHEQGWITHQDPRCSAGSIMIAGIVALSVTAEKVDPEAVCAQLHAWSKEYHVDFADYLLELPKLIARSPEEALQTIKSAGKDPARQNGWPGISPFVVGSVLWSLYSFLRTPHDYWETVKTAIEVGGDVDTTGAMAGAISGACLGLDAIPEHLARRVHDNHTWGYEELIDLADRCYRIKTGRDRQV